MLDLIPCDDVHGVPDDILEEDFRGDGSFLVLTPGPNPIVIGTGQVIKDTDSGALVLVDCTKVSDLTVAHWASLPADQKVIAFVCREARDAVVGALRRSGAASRELHQQHELHAAGLRDALRTIVDRLTEPLRAMGAMPQGEQDG